MASEVGSYNGPSHIASDQMEKRSGAFQLENWLEQDMEINTDKDWGLGEGASLIKVS